jgi:hypothetical protein
MSEEERLVLHQLESEVEAELHIVQPDHVDEAPALSQEDWLFDPSDVERYRTGLYGLLGAVKAMERDPESPSR